MKTGIVILNYNTYDLTCNLAAKCINMNSIDLVVIVDNNSSDNFDDFAAKYKDKLIYIKSDINGGYSAGNNIGIKCLISNDCTLGFIANPDVDFEENVIINICDFLKKNNEYAVASCSRFLHANGITRQFWKIPNFSFSLFESLYLGRNIQEKHCLKYSNKAVETAKLNKDFIDVEVVGGAFWGFRLDIMEKVGFLDENVFLWYEENIYARKIKKIGYKEALLVNCVYHHNHKKNGRGNHNFPIFIKSKRHYCNEYLKINS